MPPPPPPPPKEIFEGITLRLNLRPLSNTYHCTCILQSLLVIHVQNLCSCIHILQKKTMNQCIVLPVCRLSCAKCFVTSVLSQHRLNYQLAIAKVSLVNSNRSKLTLELSVCRTLLSPDFHSTFSSQCISTDSNHEMAIVYLISYLHFAKNYFLFFSWKAPLV